MKKFFNNQTNSTINWSKLGTIAKAWLRFAIALLFLSTTTLVLLNCNGIVGSSQTSGNTPSPPPPPPPPPPSNKSFTSFALAANVAAPYTPNITVIVPNTFDLSNVAATFTTNGKAVYVGNVLQTSGKTTNDFTKPVQYKIIANDNSSANYVVTAIPNAQVTAGQLYYHAKFGTLNDKAVITEFVDDPMQLSSKYNRLILSSYVGGILLNYMFDHDPLTAQVKDHYNKDYMVGSVFAQLMQEDGPEVVADYSNEATTVVAPNRDVMAAGQGGPWQLNGYLLAQIGNDRDQALINYIALQKYLGYKVADTSLPATPVAYNDVYFTPIIIAYELEQYLSGQTISLYGSRPITAQCLNNLSSVQNSPLDVVTKVIYNAGSEAKNTLLIESDCTTLAANDFGAKYNSYDSANITNDSYSWYPYQTRFYSDELANAVDASLVPTPNVAASAANNQHIIFTIGELAQYFNLAFTNVGYQTDINDWGTFHFVGYTASANAFNQAMSSLSYDTILDLSNANDRNTAYNLLYNAITNIVQNNNIDLFAITNSDIGTCPNNILKFNGYHTNEFKLGDLVYFPDAKTIYQCIVAGWCNLSVYAPPSNAWQPYILDKQCKNPWNS